MPAGAVVKYCDEHVCVCVSICLSVCKHVSGTTCGIFTNFSVHVTYGCGSVLLRHSYKICKRKGQFLGGFSSPLTMHWNAFIAKGWFNRQWRSAADHSVTVVFAAKGIIPYWLGRGWWEFTARVKCDLRLPCSVLLFMWSTGDIELEYRN